MHYKVPFIIYKRRVKVNLKFSTLKRYNKKSYTGTRMKNLCEFYMCSLHNGKGAVLVIIFNQNLLTFIRK